MAIKITHPGAFMLALLLIWLIGVLTTLTWLMIIQFFPGVTYLQVFLPFVVVYSLIVTVYILISTEEIVRSHIAKGEKVK